MTAYINKIADKAGVQQLPVTHERAVRDDNGTTLESKMQNLEGAMDKAYVASSDNGMGRITLKKNMVSGVNTLTQSMMQATNTIYVIRYDFTLGEDITVPANCVLEFDGGSLSNASGNSYTLTGNNTIINSPFIDDCIVDIEMIGTFDKNNRKSSVYTIETERFGITEGYFEKGQDGHYTQAQYDKMFNNCVGFTRAFEYAYKNKYTGVVVPRGHYCFTPVTSTICVWIFNIEHLDINLNGSTFQLLVDSTQKSSYYTLTPSNTYDYKSFTFLISSSSYISIHDGIMKGDIYTRSYINTNEKNQEQCYGVCVLGTCTHDITIRGIDFSGWSGDGVTGSPVWRTHSYPIWEEDFNTASIYKMYFLTSLTNYNVSYGENNSGTVTKTVPSTQNRKVAHTAVVRVSDIYPTGYNDYVDRYAAQKIFSIYNGSGYTYFPDLYWEHIDILTYTSEPSSIDNMPARVIPCGFTGKFQLYPNETYIRLQCHHEDDLADPVTDNENTTYSSREVKFSLVPMINENGLLEDCTFHDNGRGAVTCCINNLTIRKCRFLKAQSLNNYTLIGETPPYNVAYTNYNIDYEDGVVSNLVVEQCVFESNTVTGKLLFVRAVDVIFKNNICYGCCPAIGSVNKFIMEDNSIHYGAIYMNNYIHTEDQSAPVKKRRRSIMISNNRFDNITGFPALKENDASDIIISGCYISSYNYLASPPTFNGLRTIVYDNCHLDLQKLHSVYFLPTIRNSYVSAHRCYIYEAENCVFDINQIFSFFGETRLINCKGVNFKFITNTSISEKFYLENCEVNLQDVGALGDYTNTSDTVFKNCIINSENMPSRAYIINVNGTTGYKISLLFDGCDFRKNTVYNTIYGHYPFIYMNADRNVYLDLVNPIVNGNELKYGAGSAIAYRVSGTTAQRPVCTPIGSTYFDETLNKLIFKKYKGRINEAQVWVDATGATV